MEFRQRVGLLLEAALRVSMGVRSYRLTRTVVESVSMFKISTMSATDPEVLEWFRGVMERQYGADGGVPCQHLGFGTLNIQTFGFKFVKDARPFRRRDEGDGQEGESKPHIPRLRGR